MRRCLLKASWHVKEQTKNNFRVSKFAKLRTTKYGVVSPMRAFGPHSRPRPRHLRALGQPHGVQQHSHGTSLDGDETVGSHGGVPGDRRRRCGAASRSSSIAQLLRDGQVLSAGERRKLPGEFSRATSGAGISTRPPSRKDGRMAGVPALAPAVWSNRS